MKNAYAKDKLAAHPDILADLRRGGPGRLLQIHLSWQNTCNQNCSFCSYRMDANKNSEAFDKKKHLSVEDLGPLLEDFKEMGVQAIELTGGGEPLLHPQFDEAWELLAAGPWDIGIVTNGTMLTEERSKKVVPRLKWLRISIDAGRAETYALMRRTPVGHFSRAWEAVRYARHYAPCDPEFRLGVGFVAANENWREVTTLTALAKAAGADNVRLSSTFSDQHLAYFGQDFDPEEAAYRSQEAERLFSDDTFTVHNHIPTRLWETEHPEQDYEACYTKDLLCFVEGSGTIYMCCTWAGSEKGCYGNYLEHPGGFRGLWEEAQEWRQKFRACDYCKVSCLYRDRNLEMIGMVEATEPPQPSPDIIHKNFI